jgi:hypothetical protein
MNDPHEIADCSHLEYAECQRHSRGLVTFLAEQDNCGTEQGQQQW